MTRLFPPNNGPAPFGWTVVRTFFVNTHEQVDDNAHWSELLVQDGVVVASALKTSG